MKRNTNTNTKFFSTTLQSLAVATLFCVGLYLRFTPTQAPETYDLQTTSASAESVDESRYTSLRKIEDVRVGDLVLARDPETGVTAPRRVEDVFKRTSRHLRILTIRTSEGRAVKIETTDEHPFFVAGAEVKAGVLKTGDRIDGLASVAGTVTATQRVSHPDGITVHNLKVAGFHTYFVTAKLDQTAFWVHNADCTPGPTPAPQDISAVKNARGKGNNITVKSQREAEAILEKARPDIPWRETYGPKSKIGAEVHPIDGSGNAPGHDVELPHIKWRDWTGGRVNGAEGHIYFESINGAS